MRLILQINNIFTIFNNSFIFVPRTSKNIFSKTLGFSLFSKKLQKSGKKWELFGRFGVLYMGEGGKVVY